METAHTATISPKQLDLTARQTAPRGNSSARLLALSSSSSEATYDAKTRKKWMLRQEMMQSGEALDILALARVKIQTGSDTA